MPRIHVSPPISILLPNYPGLQLGTGEELVWKRPVHVACVAPRLTFMLASQRQHGFLNRGVLNRLIQKMCVLTKARLTLIHTPLSFPLVMCLNLFRHLKAAITFEMGTPSLPTHCTRASESEWRNGVGKLVLSVEVAGKGVWIVVESSSECCFVFS